MSYTPSMMHIVSYERRNDLGLNPDPLQAVHEQGYKRETFFSYRKLKDPIQAYDIKTLDFVKEYAFINELESDLNGANVDTLRQYARIGYINGNCIYVRDSIFKALSASARKEFVAERLKASQKAKTRAVCAFNSKDGVLHREPSLNAMALFLNSHVSTISMSISRKALFHGWGIWFEDMPQPVFLDKVDYRGKHRAKKVVVTKDGIETIYNSLGEVEKLLNTDHSTVSRACKKGYKVKGYEVRFLMEVKR